MPTTFSKGSAFRPWFYDKICGWEERKGLLEWRQRLVGDLTGTILEVGAGTGLNLPHYPSAAVVLVSERDPLMLRRAVDRASVAEADTALLVADAQGKLPFPDASVETVVCALMLCSVPDQHRTIAEIKRVLRPGGRLRFVEHVRDEEGSMRARIQDRVNPVWRKVSGGCNCNRDTVTSIEAAGFEVTELHRFPLGLSHVAPHVMGGATVR